jgi:hypothetical protein
MLTLEMGWKRGKNYRTSFNWNMYLNVLNANAQKADFMMASFKEIFLEMFYE